jgi:hypothetical protein
LFIVFVVGGQVCILIGGFLGWRWVRKLGFRIAHLLAIGVVVVESWVGMICPLTIWENTLRRMGGEMTYTGTFVSHWVGRAIYFNVPEWVFTIVHTLFGIVVLASWFLVRPTRRRRAESPPGDNSII